MSSSASHAESRQRERKGERSESFTDTRTATERHAQGSGERADVHMASKEPLNDVPSRSSVEVEQLLPSAEHDPDPRDFYASDSPIRIRRIIRGSFSECLDPEVQDDDQSRAAHMSETSGPTSQHLLSQPHPSLRLPKCPAFIFSADVAFAATNDSATQLSRGDRPSVSQHQDVASGGHSSSRPRAFARTQNAGLGQQESHTNAGGLPCPCQNVNNRGRMHEERSEGNIGETIRKRRGRSPRRRGVGRLELAELVRMEIDSLLQDDPPYGRTPERSQVSRFATEWKCTGQGAKACNATPGDFMIDVAGLPRSPWNISAARVFTDHFIGKMECSDTPDMRKK
ncbi:hypothetical protein BC827DRAFT_1273687 [Russula dissimulans]|nr:hypothetical protein BC827DRAFT_1273687 [Russula dissimulans]